MANLAKFITRGSLVYDYNINVLLNYEASDLGFEHLTQELTEVV